MTLTIIVPDQTVIIDGRAISPIDMSGMNSVRAVQWNGSVGHEELMTGKNRNLDSIAKYQFIIDRWQTMANAIDNPVYTKDDAFTVKMMDIKRYFDQKCYADFTYNGHSYTADYLQISGMSQNCIILNGSDPIPTIDGKWSTNEIDGISPVRVAFTCAEFIQFAAAFAGRRVANFAVKQSHETAVRSLHADNDKTAQDILNYDHTTGGWQ